MKYILFTVFFVSILSSCSKNQKENDRLSIVCDAEESDGTNLISNDESFQGGDLRSSSVARSGKYSIKLNEKSAFGFTYEILDVKKGDVIEASVWKYLKQTEGSLVVSPDGGGQGQHETNSTIISKEGDWGLIKIVFIANKDYDKVLVFASSGAKQSTYFDDFSIDVFFNTKMPPKSAGKLEIDIPRADFDVLKNNRLKALKQGVISKDLKDYVDANIVVDGRKIPIEVRLKGDWTDHLKSNKWSLRIKIKGDYAYRGMKTFSIQNPYTRSFMNEWFAHKVYEKEDVLTTRFIFVPIVINGEQKGVYALEEHFQKELLEYKKRREGPIVKFDESGVWQQHRSALSGEKHYDVGTIESAEITPFKKSSTLKSPVLSQQFSSAQSQMEKYRSGSPDVNDYFDSESLAKFIALSDVLNGKHGLIWHNQRNYLNPVTNKLEPIAYDCYVDPNNVKRGVTMEGVKFRMKGEHSLIQNTLADPEVEELYFAFLQKFSNEEYFKGIFKEMSDEIAAAEKLLSHEYPNIKLDKGFFKGNCKQVRSQLKGYRNLRKKKVEESDLEVGKDELLPAGVIYTEIALKANIEKTDSTGQTTVSLRNFHTSELVVYGYTTKENKTDVIPIPEVQLKANQHDAISLELEQRPRRLLYRAKNCGNRSFKAKLYKWSNARSVRSEVKNYLTVDASSNTVVLSGNVSISKDTYIPKGTKLIVQKGTKINLSKNAVLVSYSPVEFQGTEDAPIKIYSSDNTGNGLVVISDQKSEIYHTQFENLNTNTKNSWILTGAVTLYGGEVKMDHVSVKNNHCEDGLNLIRMKFAITNSQFSGMYSDGFDADFCEGKISSSKFENSGNDCLDFSGSRVEISNCEIINAGDKGISGGERSQLKVDNCSVNGAYISVVAKDQTSIIVSDIRVSNCEYVFAAYQKKAEYGSAEIDVTSVREVQSKFLYLVERNSRLKYLGKTYMGATLLNFDLEGKLVK